MSAPMQRGNGDGGARRGSRGSGPHPVLRDQEDGRDAGNDQFSVNELGDEGKASGHEASSMLAAQRSVLTLLERIDVRRIVAVEVITGNSRTRVRQRHDEKDEKAGGHVGIGKRRRDGDKYPALPTNVGKALMASGAFGDNEPFEDRRKNMTVSSRIFRRELGFYSVGGRQLQNRLIAQSMIPSSAADTIIYYDARCYSGQFSDDGNFFFTCCQDFKIRLYDTSNPCQWKYSKSIEHPDGRWTITDATLSPDNKFLACSSMNCFARLVSTDPNERVDPVLLNFSTTERRQLGGSWYAPYTGFMIWSLRFSGDGRELVAGTSDHSVHLYDIETQTPTFVVHGHKDDVNAVCFADKASPHILYSGSDDTTLKVWDRRSMRHKRAAGVFVGHTEGLTYVDSKSDGRYVLSNGKDQRMKLWDIRKMVSTERFDATDPTKYTSGFDYRYETFVEQTYKPHPDDCSLVTFHGHSVLKTLIRCHFSPPDSSNSRYVYTGSSDGKVYIYNLDATLAGTVDVNESIRPQDPDLLLRVRAAYRELGMPAEWTTCVRDASWHPSAPIIAATSWSGWGMSKGNCTVHNWKSGVKKDEVGVRLNERLEPRQGVYGADWDIRWREIGRSGWRIWPFVGGRHDD